MTNGPATILAFAGRRVDPMNAKTQRIPLTQVEIVQKTEDLFSKSNVQTLMYSAACGANLIVLQAAKRLGIDYRIFWSFALERF